VPNHSHGKSLGLRLGLKIPFAAMPATATESMRAMIKVSTLWNGLPRSVKNFPVPWKKSIKAEKNEMSVSMRHAGAGGLSDQSTACKGSDTEAL